MGIETKPMFLADASAWCVQITASAADIEQKQDLLNQQESALTRQSSQIERDLEEATRGKLHLVSVKRTSASTVIRVLGEDSLALHEDLD